MSIGDRVRYVECVECIPDRGLGTVIGKVYLGWVVKWDIGVSNLCFEENLRRV